jgi:hypothetical protein
MTLVPYPERASLQYAIVRNVCYPDQPPACVSNSFERVTGWGTVMETNGTRLTKINTDRIHEGRDAETILATIAHEAAHTGHGGTHGRGVASHPPEFWEEFARVARILLTDDTAWSAVQTVFERELDRHRFKYRLLQELTTNQVDKRQQSEDECKATFAENIGFDEYGMFDNVYIMFGQESVPYFDGDPYSIRLDGVSETYRPAVGFSDDTLLEFAHKIGTKDDSGNILVPSPLLHIEDGDAVLMAPDGGAAKPDMWRQAKIDDVEYISSQDPNTVRQMLALHDRMGRDCWGTDARVVDDGCTPVLDYGLEFPEFSDDVGGSRVGNSLTRLLSF